MDAQPLITLAEEAHTALSLMILPDGRAHVAEISECNRRATSVLADFHAESFKVFLPPLHRAAATSLAEALHAYLSAVFSAALLLQGHTMSPSENRKAEYESLGRMSAQLVEAVTSLARYVRGKHPTPPDTFRFYKEAGLARALHAKEILHSERSLHDRATSESLAKITSALREAYRATLILMMESV